MYTYISICWEVKIIKILIAGSRSIEDFDLSPYVPPHTTMIISGGAKGVDKLAEQYADKHRISKLVLQPWYELYGKIAPIKRDELMVDLADEVLIVWDGVSRGAKYTAEYARKSGKRVTVLLYDQHGEKEK